MPTQSLETTLKNLPALPGVYRMYNASGELIYVGKAKVLKNRVRSYFQKNAQHTPKVQSMVAQIAHLDTVITNSEMEALILETNLIKKNLPRYNILARDDKKSPWIGLSDGPFPRLFITRTPDLAKKRNAGGTKFFGPYVNVGDMHTVLRLLKKHFPMRQRLKPLFKNRPCMNYFIGTCPGPCQNLVAPEDYQKTVEQVELFLRGRTDELIALLETQMQKASEAMDYEDAAKVRDRLMAIASVSEQQKVLFHDETMSIDVLGITGDDLRCAMTIQSIRHGKLIASQSRDYRIAVNATLQETYNQLVWEHYRELPPGDMPDQVVLQFMLEDEDLLQMWLNEQRKSLKKSRTKQVQLWHPEKGDKRALLDIAITNANEALERARHEDAHRLKNDPVKALISLQEILDLPDYPERMECYDISHFQGSETVASMVVFVNGEPDKSQYRRFKIHSAEGEPDDFKSMAEVIKRRFSHRDWDDPDLLIIDGGKGQLGAALGSLEKQGVNDQPIISLAKKFEEVFVPNNPRPVLISRDAPALFLLQQIRDEAHRFAITYHRKLRSKKAHRSALDDIEGIGEKTKALLLTQFKNVREIEKVDLETLIAVPGLRKNQAEMIYKFFHPIS